MKHKRLNSFCRITLLPLIFLVGCSTPLTGKEPAKLVELKSSVRVDIRWLRHTGFLGGAALKPAVMDGIVYGANANGELFRLDPLNGKKVWGVDVGFKVSGAVGAGEGVVLVGGLKSELAAFDEEGSLLWLTKVSSEVMDAPQVVDGIVLVRTSAGRIEALSAKDGQRQWLYERSTPTLSVRNHAGVAIQQGVVYAGFAAGRLVAINLTNGAVIWESAVSQPRGNTELERISDITSVPMVDREKVCAVSFQGRLACFDISNGVLLWSRALSSDKGLGQLQGYIYLSDVDGTVWALDKTNGSTLWKNDQLYMRQTAAPYVTEKHVIVGDFEGYVHVLNREDGKLVARTDTNGSPISFAPIPFAKGFVLQARDGGVYAIDIN